ncbi:MAG: TonB-dependent receptor [Paludibacter sp.]|nr:TonB-dependent receptor [Paludibacter sp.]
MKIIISIVLSLFSVGAFAAETNIVGHVVNDKTREHLSYITIAVKGTTIGTRTDATGHYKLGNVAEGKQIITVKGIGYAPVEKEIVVLAGKANEINFEVSEDLVQLNEVVVSSNRNETTKREASNIVNIITPKLFETTSSVCLAQGLSFQPGLRVETNCQNCGFQQVRINGLDGPYSQILIDSRPIFSALAGVYGIEQIPTNMIERVEVVRGGGSALFGSNAIAGTINIITKEPLNNSLTLSNQTTFIGGNIPDVNTSLNAALVSKDNKTGVSLYASSRQRSAYDADGDGFTEIGVLQSRNVGFRSYYKTSNQSKLTAEYHNLGEFRRGGNKLDLPAHQADITEQIEHNINSGGLKYDLFSADYKHRLNIFTSAQNIARKSYYGAGKDPNAYGTTKDLSSVTGAQYMYAMEKLLFMPSDLTLGAEYSYNNMVDKQLGYDRQLDQTVYTYSAYFQNEWKNKYWSVLVGGRFDKHNLIKDPIFSPRLNLRYNPSESVNFRASYGSGFRAPQAFDEDLHITAVAGQVQIIKLDPNLKTERSNSFSVSGDFYKQFGKVQTNLLIEGFYTNLNNVFVLEEDGIDADGNSILMRRNGLGAVVKGVNVEAKIMASSQFQFQMGATLQQSKYKENQKWSENPNVLPQRNMFRTPNKYSYLTLTYNPAKQFTLALSGTYTGSMFVQHYAGYVAEDEEVKTPEFLDMNFRMSYDFLISEDTKLQINAGVQNILNSYQKDFDKGEFRDAGFVYGPSLPRSIFVGLKLNI